MSPRCDATLPAGGAGFNSVGLWLKPLLASDAVTVGDGEAERLVRLRLAETGLRVLDIGVVAIDEALRAADLAPLMAFSRSIGARFLVCPVADPDEARRADTLAALCAAAAPYSLVPLVEFNPYSACTSLAAALDLVARAGHATRSEAELRAESRGARLLPGEGSLWLRELLTELPDDIPFSVEAPSASLAGLSPEARAEKAYAAVRRFLAERE